MKNDFEDNNNSPIQEDSYEGNDQEIIFYKKYNKKRRKKFIALNNGKVFYEEDEDIYNVYRNLGLIDNYINKNTIKQNRKLSQNDAIPHKKKLKKRNSLIIIDNKYNLKKINNNNDNKKRKKKSNNKKVSFLKDHFVEYIDVESYKKYYSLLTDKDWNLNKAHAKCTCNIY
jgi:hypothetical protein